MGVCYSCLGLGGRDSHDSESSRLLDDELYQSSYGYGAVGSGQRQGPDPEDLKREREALEAICQRTSDSVIDIWALQPHAHAHAPPSIHTANISSTRTPSHQTASSATTEDAQSAASPQSPEQERRSQNSRGETRRAVSPAPGEFGKLRYAPLHTSHNGNISAVPKHWGEVVMTTRKGKKVRRGLDISQENDGNNKPKDLFGVLVVD
ncbi:hypothetical protein FQN52_002928 [Onygenales sp. PD_12]|nr:hypothetical protein FQN52_002928 [Onygenales sp. PD_12]